MTVVNPQFLKQQTHDDFQTAFEEMQREAHEINRAHGFDEPDRLIDELECLFSALGFAECSERFMPLIDMCRQARTGLKLSLIMSELSEALEGVRNGNKPDSHIPQFTAEEAELADAVIRIMNLATENRCRLAAAIVAKQNYNCNRPFKHGGKKF